MHWNVHADSDIQVPPIVCITEFAILYCGKRRELAMGNETGGIDFVLTWVDGSDPAWLEEKRQYEKADATKPHSGGEANSECRYRDCGLLKYWFRGIEKFAPWYNRVFFITCGQRPDWLDESHPKLRLVNHTDYIPSDYLPTFHSNTIELNVHRIDDLSECFVMFNDDMFLLRPVAERQFFADGLPVLPCDLGIPGWFAHSFVSRILFNNAVALNQSLDVERLVRQNMAKFLNVRSLGFRRVLKNYVSFAVNKLVIAGSFEHLPLPHLKSTFDEMWRVQPQMMEETSRSRFRTDSAVNHWLAGAWNMVTGRFSPINEKLDFRGRSVVLTAENASRICESIRNQEYPQICINDSDSIRDAGRVFADVAKAFDSILPVKSSFEK